MTSVLGRNARMKRESGPPKVAPGGLPANHPKMSCCGSFEALGTTSILFTVKYRDSSLNEDIMTPFMAFVGQAIVGSVDETNIVGERPGAKIGTGISRTTSTTLFPSGPLRVLSLNTYVGATPYLAAIRSTYASHTPGMNCSERTVDRPSIASKNAVAPSLPLLS